MNGKTVSGLYKNYFSGDSKDFIYNLICKTLLQFLSSTNSKF